MFVAPRQMILQSQRARLIQLFEMNAPRYTSYPTADRLSKSFDARTYIVRLANRSRPDGPAGPLSLYFHLPFCSSVCFYCACNKIITRNHEHSVKYIRYLEQELELQAGFLQGPPDVIQLHLGGGTPTFLSHVELRQLMCAMRKHFRLLPGGECSIEVDPRSVDTATVVLLGELGFNRMSLGVQDLDLSVQEAVNRVQSFRETEEVVVAARANGFHSVSLDLIYGLPKQTPESFDRTLQKIIELDPDRLSVYNYAHLPQINRPQRRINEADLPSADTKIQILELVINRLTQAGYVYIGMDHFAKPDDSLTIAQRQGRLQRNFQGYSTHAGCDLMSFGVSAIAKVGSSYAQNYKGLADYYRALDQGHLPISRGLEATPDDQLRHAIIQALMCNFEVSVEAIQTASQIDFHKYFSREIADLRRMEDAGILKLSDATIQVLPPGRLLVRAIAMVFDRYLRDTPGVSSFSKVI